MKKTYLLITLLALIASVWVVPTAAQGPFERVELEAEDGLILVGNYYAPPAEGDSPAPAVLLMHHGGARKELWVDLVPLLTEAGYAVLNVDLRGHGETGGPVDLLQTQDDTHRWLAWLRDQEGVDPDRVSIVGASMGADVGLPVMAEDARIVTLVGLSVALQLEDLNSDYVLDNTVAVPAIGDRPLYLVAGRGVEEEAEAVVTLTALAEGDVQARLYNNSACCTYLFMFDNQLAPSIIDWLDVHN